MSHIITIVASLELLFKYSGSVLSYLWIALTYHVNAIQIITSSPSPSTHHDL